MKFNKSAESDFWYVGFDSDINVGKIFYSEHSGCKFSQDNFGLRIPTKCMKEIFEFMHDIERDSGIDTTSTFTSNESIK